MNKKVRKVLVGSAVVAAVSAPVAVSDVAGAAKPATKIDLSKELDATALAKPHLSYIGNEMPTPAYESTYSA